VRISSTRGAAMSGKRSEACRARERWRWSWALPSASFRAFGSDRDLETQSPVFTAYRFGENLSQCRNGDYETKTYNFSSCSEE
jgi:hypothetical protein